MNEHRAAPPGGDPDAVALWASARVTELLGHQDQPVPVYGSREWQLLDSNDPRKAAAILTAAESWRRFGHEDLSVLEAAEMWRRYGSEVVQWFKEASAPHAPIAERRTLAELDALARPKPARPVLASEGWPPVAIPGRPGWWRHLINGEQVDLPTRDPQQVAA